MAKVFYEKPKEIVEVQVPESALEVPLPEVAPVQEIVVTSFQAKPKNEPKDVNVRIRLGVPRTRIGKEWYHFAAGKEYLVPVNVANVLREKGII